MATVNNKPTKVYSLEARILTASFMGFVLLLICASIFGVWYRLFWLGLIVYGC